jgi:hypothetical protein
MMASMAKARRVIHMTFYKCGSQWVRDVLTAPEIVALTGTPLVPADTDLVVGEWPAQPESTCLAPLYTPSYGEWKMNRRDGDKGVVVLRDPRDMMVSMVFSVCYSHRTDSTNDYWREFLLSVSPWHRWLWGMSQMSLFYRAMRSWAGRSSTDWEFLTSYEALVRDPVGEFSSVTRFLGWDIPEPVLKAVNDRLSFKQRSGRSPGEADVFSHYRKGQAGDWRNHFDRRLGEIWEIQLPGLLSALGYEQGNDWAAGLPVKCDDDDDFRLSETINAVGLQAELVRCREENAELRKGFQALQAHIEGMERRAGQGLPQG